MRSRDILPSVLPHTAILEDDVTHKKLGGIQKGARLLLPLGRSTRWAMRSMTRCEAFRNFEFCLAWNQMRRFWIMTFSRAAMMKACGRISPFSAEKGIQRLKCKKSAGRPVSPMTMYLRFRGRAWRKSFWRNGPLRTIRINFIFTNSRRTEWRMARLFTNGAWGLAWV